VSRLQPRTERDEAVRAAAARSLGVFGDPGVLEALVVALDDAPVVARAAAASIGALAHKAVTQSLLQRLGTPDDELFLELAGALAAIGERTAVVEVLRTALRRGVLVPFLGPDLPGELTGLPARAELARELAKQDHGPVFSSFAAVAQATMRNGPSKFVFTSFLSAALSERSVPPGPIYRALAELDVPLWLSAAYDLRLHEALRMQGRNHRWVVSGGEIAPPRRRQAGFGPAVRLHRPG
jgi:hypothetical protein